MTHGIRLGLRANNAQTLERLLPHLPPGWKVSSQPVVERLYSIIINAADVATEPKAPVRRFNLLYGDSTRLARALETEQILEAFETDVQLYVAENALRRVFVHAGVVGWRGRAILLPGRSFSGKTTLVAELVQAGATYYSDEYAVLDAQGRVHPYPRLLSMRSATAYDEMARGLPMTKPTRLTATQLGGRVGRQPLPVGLVVLSEYKPRAKWCPRPVSAGQGALGLLANTVSARRQPTVVLATLRQATRQARVIQSARGEVADVAEAILREVDEGLTIVD